MRRAHLIVLSAGTLGVVAALIGCESSGLSEREVRGRDYATYAYTAQGDEARMTAAESANARPSESSPGSTAQMPSLPLPHATQLPAKPITPPVRIAVAQIGEVAPPREMLDQLRHDHAAFAIVQPVSGVIDTAPPGRVGVRPEDYSAQKAAQDHADRMRDFARDIGADYLFIYGGTVDKAKTSSPLVLANATIIGAFIVPGEVIQADARAAGHLIDVQSGRVVLSCSADARERHRSATVAVDGDTIKMLESMRTKIVEKLANDLTARVKEQAAATAKAAG
jgi:hypothetical protein